jgi:uncharacterized membrane protein
MKKYFITGLLIWVPLAITAWVLSLIVRTMDQTCCCCRRRYIPSTCWAFISPASASC